MSKEAYSMWLYSKGSGWGQGRTGDPKALFSDAAAKWFWTMSKELTRLGIYKTSNYSNSNAVMNWLGAMQSARGIWEAVYLGDQDSQYANKSYQERMLFATPEDAWGGNDFIDIALNVQNPADPGLKSGSFQTWGNYGNPRDGFYTLYFWDSFGIYERR